MAGEVYGEGRHEPFGGPPGDPLANSRS
jgi:hypothetical protein